MNVVKLKRYLGVILAGLMLFAYWPYNGSNYEKPSLTFLDETFLSVVFRELNLSADYRMIADYYGFGVHCRGNPSFFGYRDHRCDEPETFYPDGALDQILLIEDSSKELQVLLSDKELENPFHSPEFIRTFSKAAREYAKSRISSVKALIYVVHAAWFIFFLIVLHFREKVGNAVLVILRALFVAVSSLLRTIHRFLKGLHNRV
jgi:hypothetical protein